MSQIRFPYLSIYIALFATPIFVGIYYLLMAASFNDVIAASLVIMLGVPALVSAISLWRGDAWALKSLVVFFLIMYVFSVYVNAVEGVPVFTVLLLSLFY